MAAVSSAKGLSVVVPTVGASPFLVDRLRALRREVPEGAHILVVDQGSTASRLPEGLADRILSPGRNLGFAGGMNLGFAECRTEYLAAVNDDLIVEEGWAEVLLEALEEHPGAAAAQGIHFRLEAPGEVDGAGLAFNSWWQAVQRGHGEPLSEWMEGREIQEIFGVSATAAIYRRSALEAVALEAGKPAMQIFDEGLESYYEDVDLACRLRNAGFSSLLARRARAGHGGSITGKALGRRRLALIYGNRWATLARFLGADFGRFRRRIFGRDLRDLLRALSRFRWTAVGGIAQGMARGRRLLPSFRHDGRAPGAARTRERFPVESPRGTP